MGNLVDPRGHEIADVLAQHGVKAKAVAMAKGAAVTRYELELGRGVKVEQVKSLAETIANKLGASSIAITTGSDGSLGVEVPNTRRSAVSFAEALNSIEHNAEPLTVPIGQAVDGQWVTADLAAMPHLLVSGTTGSGKSVWLNGALSSLLSRNSPEGLELVLIDVKRVELAPYRSVEHLARPLVTEAGEAARVLTEVLELVEERYEALEAEGVRSLAEHNEAAAGDRWACRVVVIDELADLVMVGGKAVIETLARIAQIGRAAGVHLVACTQRPAADVIPKLLSANLPSRLSFAVQSHTESQIALGQSGAEDLLGKGDALFSPVGARQLQRVQSANITLEEIREAASAATAEPEIPEPGYRRLAREAREREIAAHPERYGKPEEPEPEEPAELPEAAEIILDSLELPEPVKEHLADAAAKLEAMAGELERQRAINAELRQECRERREYADSLEERVAGSETPTVEIPAAKPERVPERAVSDAELLARVERLEAAQAAKPAPVAKPAKRIRAGMPLGLQIFFAVLLTLCGMAFMNGAGVVVAILSAALICRAQYRAGQVTDQSRRA